MESRKAKKQKSNKTNNNNKPSNLKLLPITGKTRNQKLFFQRYKNYQVLSLTGYAGTGKSFISLHQALLSVENGEYNEVLIIRSAVPSRDMGFLPGNKKEKMAVYEAPYMSICSKLYGRGDAYNILKQQNIIKFEASSYLRGETFENCVIVIDEAQNFSLQELYTVLTRIGENCKLIICGDTRQDDLTSERYHEQSGYRKILDVLSGMESCYSIEFEIEDIVRSGFVKEFILATSH